MAVIVSCLAGCNTLRDSTKTDKEPTAPLLAGPSKYHLRDSQFVYYSDFPINSNLPIFKELSDLREQIVTELQLPASNTIIQVFLFEDQAKYEAFMRTRHPELPVRRAFFIKQPKNNGGTADLLVYTWWGEKIRQDLRHELTHGILHSVLKDVPLWLDEGLAEVYELPPENNGVNTTHVEAIRKGSFHPDLAKLEQLSEVKQMLTPEYREAWAWAHFLLRGKPEAKAALLSYLQTLRQSATPTPLLMPELRKTFPAPNDAMATHFSRVESPKASRLVSNYR